MGFADNFKKKNNDQNVSSLLPYLAKYLEHYGNKDKAGSDIDLLQSCDDRGRSTRTGRPSFVGQFESLCVVFTWFVILFPEGISMIIA